MTRILFAALINFGLATASLPLTSESVLFRDDFESGLGAWEVRGGRAITVVDSTDTRHRKVLQMTPNGEVPLALINGSERWGVYRIEGDVLFPTDVSNYAGFVYNYRKSARREDFGTIYIKGNDSYVRVNPRRDWNPARAIYQEYDANLTGSDAIQIGKWHHFAAEVKGRICHFYAGDMKTPKVTFDLYEHDSGKAGLKPRVVGGPVWVDNIQVRSLQDLSYQGPPKPAQFVYDRKDLMRDWKVLGPLTRTYPTIEEQTSMTNQTIEDDGVRHRWQPFATDVRGAVLTGLVTEFLGSKTVAYFSTNIKVDAKQELELQFSSIDDLAIWVNGVFEGYILRDYEAWYDFGLNAKHPPTDTIPLKPGSNYVLLRVRGGQYAGGGFFVRLTR